MNNPAMRYAAARGLGALGDDYGFYFDAAHDGSVIGSDGKVYGGGGYDWGSLIGGIGSAISNVFNRGGNANNAGYTQAQLLQLQQLQAQQQAALLAQQQGGGGVGFGLDGNGIRLSDGSHIGWFPIIGVIGAFALLQSKGFSRR